MDHQVTPKGIQPMIWETNERKRNDNNIYAFSIPIEVEINEGDRIIAVSDKENYSVYEIVKIIEIRPSKLSGRNYLTAKTKWYKQQIIN